MLAVLCDDAEQVATVRDYLRKEPYKWPGRNGDGWYDGRLDYLFDAEVDDESGATVIQAGNWVSGPVTVGAHMSYGDNRAFAYVKSEAVLGSVGRVNA